jgi:hypothetical protein
VHTLRCLGCKHAFPWPWNGLKLSHVRMCPRVQIPVCPEPPLDFSHELLCGLRTGFLVVSPLRIASALLHVERGRSSKRVWRSPRIIYLFFLFSEENGDALAQRGSRKRCAGACMAPSGDRVHGPMEIFNSVRVLETIWGSHEQHVPAHSGTSARPIHSSGGGREPSSVSLLQPTLIKHPWNPELVWCVCRLQSTLCAGTRMPCIAWQFSSEFVSLEDVFTGS